MIDPENPEEFRTFLATRDVERRLDKLEQAATELTRSTKDIAAVRIAPSLLKRVRNLRKALTKGSAYVAVAETFALSDEIYEAIQNDDLEFFETGRKQHEASEKGNKIKRDTVAERTAKIREEYATRVVKNPSLGKTVIKQDLADEYGVSLKTIRRAVE